MAEADGQEILVVDGDEKVQRGLAQLLSENGLVPTVVSDAVRARELAREKYFAVALIDLDTPQTNAGLELTRWFKQNAPTTTTIVMCSRKVFESSVEAFRAGAADVIVKSPDQVQYLKQRTVEAAQGVQKSLADDKLIHEVLGVHEDFLRRLMEASRKTAELEEQLGGGSHPSAADEDCSLLVVEDDGWLGQQLKSALDVRGGYTLVTAASGGEALDRATGRVFQLALVRDALPDLTGSMVVSTLKAQSPDTLTILFSRPSGARPGRAEVLEGSKAIPLVPEFSDAKQMVERIDELREAFRRKSRERRYLAAFRQENYELLKRYADLKQRLQRAGK
ncbi:MAG TPA: response regulator [Polyangia bacterium]